VRRTQPGKGLDSPQKGDPKFLRRGLCRCIKYREEEASGRGKRAQGLIGCLLSGHITAEYASCLRKKEIRLNNRLLRAKEKKDSLANPFASKEESTSSPKNPQEDRISQLKASPKKGRKKKNFSKKHQDVRLQATFPSPKGEKHPQENRPPEPRFL